MTFQNGLLSPLKGTFFYEKCIFVMDVVMTLLVPAESVNTRMVIIYCNLGYYCLCCMYKNAPFNNHIINIFFMMLTFINY